jgi:hypothetical protein
MKPANTEYPPYYEYYINLVAESDLLKALQLSGIEIIRCYENIPETLSAFRYESGKWSMKELLQHIIDTERIMSYRALCFSRRDETTLPGFDQNSYAQNSGADLRSLELLLKDFSIMRQSTISLFHSFDNAQLLQKGTASGNHVSVRSLGFMIAGHGLHHLDVLKKRYLK